MNALVGLNAVTLIFAALCVFAIGYRFYGVFMANKVLKLDKDRPMPSVTQVREKISDEDLTIDEAKALKARFAHEPVRT